MRDAAIVFGGHSHAIAVEYSPSVRMRGSEFAMRQIFSGVRR